MYKKKFTDEQTELLALLPQGLPKMTDGAKLVLANIILWYGTDAAQKSGTMYRTNLDMMEDTGIKSEKTIIRTIKQLETLGMVTSKRGKRGEASEYRLSEEMLDKIHFNPIDTECQSTVITPQSTVIDSQSTVINQLVEQNKSLTLMVSELQGTVKHLTDMVETMLKQSKYSTDTDTESDKEKITSTSTSWFQDEVSTTNDEVNSGESTGASAHNDSFSSFNSEKETHAAGSFSTDDTTPNGVTSTSVVSSNDDLNQTDRFTLSQSEEKNTPQVPLHPPLNEWLDTIKAELRHGIYEWSLTLTDDVVTSDDANGIVHAVLTQHPEWSNYNFSLLELGHDTKCMMENRVMNSDVKARIKENQYQQRHKAYRKELMSA